MTARTVAQGEAVRQGLAVTRGGLNAVYADPIAWLAVDAVADALRRCPEDVHAARDDVAVILVSAYGTRFSLSAVAGAAPSGRVSPMRFAGASPAGAGSLPCLVHGFRGPSLMLAMPPEAGLPVAHRLAGSWLARGAAAYAVVSAHEVHAGEHRIRTWVLAPGGPAS